MKKITSLYSLTLAVLLMLTACQSDNIEEQGGAQNSDGKALVTLRIATDNGKASTRAWQDVNAKTDRTEMMYSWYVLLIDANNKVVYKNSRTTVANDNAEIDVVAENLELAAGTYTAYNFANIPESSLPTAIKKDVGSDFSSDDATALTNATYTVNGNGFTPSSNQGIPMSNKQTLTIAAGDTEKDLIVVRMLAKIEVQVYNEGASDVVVNTIALTDVTANAANNLMLLPNYGTTPDYPDDMAAHHMDIQPNLGSGATRDNLIFIPAGDATARTIPANTTTTPVTFTFYVNESVAPDNGSGLFYLSFGFDGQTEYHHALINQKGSTTNDDDAWHYIARNDYRVIPVHLTDWLFRIEPLAFVPIGGYPAVTVSSDAHHATFSTGGMIALQPFVKMRGEDTWRDFDNSEVEFVSLSWKNSDGENKAVYNSDGTEKDGAGKIVKTAFAYDPVTKSIIGELNSAITTPDTYKTAVTFTVKVGPANKQYTYSFTCDVNLQVGSGS